MDWLTTATQRRQAFVLGELRVSFEGDTAFVEGPPGDGQPVELEPVSEDVAAYLRTGRDGRYRSLPGATGMRPGWWLRCPVARLGAILDAIYPLATAHVAGAAAGTLRIVPLDEVLARQSGRYEVTSTLSTNGREAAVASLCARCVRTPVWDSETPSKDGIPCPEACSVFVSLCRELALDGPAAVHVSADATVAFANFEDPANPVLAEARALIR